MTENSENNESENKTVSAEAAVTASSAMTAEATVAFSADNIRDRLKKDEYALALVLTSTRLESIMSMIIRDHYNWDSGKFEKEGYDNYSLGRLIEECVKYGALPEYEDTLNKMRSGEMQIVILRNNLVHDYGFLSNVEADQDLQQEVEDAIEKTIELIESVEV